jgi:hypothetical protein
LIGSIADKAFTTTVARKATRFKDARNIDVDLFIMFSSLTPYIIIIPSSIPIAP